MIPGNIFFRAPVGALAIATALMLGTSGVRADEDWRNLYLDAKPVFDVRYRFEYVDQDSAAKDAKAHTVRTRAGLETGRFHGFGAGFDVEWIEAPGTAKFNDTINGKSQYPVVADPDDFQVNQLFFVSDGTVPGTALKLGRQRIIWDNARFIGNVGFRQNEQTFDALRATVTAIPATTLEYTYIDEVHRIFGTDSPSGDLGMQGHGVRAQYSGFDRLTITPFALLVDYDRNSLAGLDSQTYGLLIDGKQPLGDDWTLLYAGSVAHQSDYADNPGDFGLWYYWLEGGLKVSGITAKAGYEVLEGDGTSAFQTPLATLHKFNGLTDQFLTTPADGLEDIYLSVNAAIPAKGLLSDMSFGAGFHDYRAESGSRHYGSEWDVGLFKKIRVGSSTVNLGLQYASYSADHYASDTDKLWLTLEFKLGPKPLRGYLGEDAGTQK